MRSAIVQLIRSSNGHVPQHAGSFCGFMGVESKVVDRSFVAAGADANIVADITHFDEADSEALISWCDSPTDIFIYGHNDKALSRILGSTFVSYAPRLTSIPSFKNIGKYMDQVQLGEAQKVDFFTDLPEQDREAVFIAEAGLVNYCRLTRGNARLYVCANRDIIDVTRSVAGSCRKADLVLEFVQLHHFLTSVCADSCWQYPPPAANIIVDDPYLTKRYGFFKTTEVLDTLAEEDLALTLAFIPWNYRRSDRQITEAVIANQHLHLCIHGNDHTRGEFGSTNTEELRRKIVTALSRMDHLRDSSSVTYQNMMVFPQGIFSQEALLALHDLGVTAGVNTGICPVQADSVPVAALLSPTISWSSPFPLFRRYRPEEVADCELLINCHLGIPMLFVVHHAYFERAPDCLQDLGRRVSALDAAIAWRPLEEIIEAHSARRSVDDHCEVRAFTDRAEIHPPGLVAGPYLITRRVDCAKRVACVTVDGSPVEYHQEDDLVTVLCKPAGRTVTFRIEHKAVPTTKARVGLKESGRVLARRLLCDFRDNMVAPSASLLRLAGLARKGGLLP